MQSVTTKANGLGAFTCAFHSSPIAHGDFTAEPRIRPAKLPTDPRLKNINLMDAITEKDLQSEEDPLPNFNFLQEYKAIFLRGRRENWGSPYDDPDPDEIDAAKRDPATLSKTNTK
ncbi:hypothetical protein QOT17_013627 [Balamuthia mandrillaris]